MKHIIQGGRDTYRATCHECGCVFTYEREDVRHNYVRGGEWVDCPTCGHGVRHLGASGSEWPTDGRRGCGRGRLTVFPRPTHYTTLELQTYERMRDLRVPRA